METVGHRRDNLATGTHSPHMAKTQRSVKHRLLRLFLWLAGIVLAFLAYGELFGWQTDYFVMAHYTASRLPFVNVAPQPLADRTCSQAPGATLSYYGNSFDVPWKGITEEKRVGKVTVVKFASGQVLMVWTPTGKRGFLEDVAEDKDTGSPAMRALFAEDIKDTPYEQESALLNITSAQVKFFNPPRMSERGAFLLFFKGMSQDAELKTGAFEFQTPTVRGFQIGNPVNARRTRLDFFDSTGDSLGEIICFFGKGISARGTQAELNRIIQTFHVVRNIAAPSTSAKNPPHPAHR